MSRWNIIIFPSVAVNRKGWICFFIQWVCYQQRRRHSSGLRACIMEISVQHCTSSPAFSNGLLSLWWEKKHHCGLQLSQVFEQPCCCITESFIGLGSAMARNRRLTVLTVVEWSEWYAFLQVWIESISSEARRVVYYLRIIASCLYCILSHDGERRRPTGNKEQS